jgi:hypothetical protein
MSENQNQILIYNQLDNAFKQHLALYLLVSRVSEITFNINLKFEILDFNILIKCIVKNLSRDTIDFHYVIKFLSETQQEKLNFIQFYYIVFEKIKEYHTIKAEEEEEEEIFEYEIVERVADSLKTFFRDFFNKIYSHPSIKTGIDDINAYDKTHEDKYSNYTSETWNSFLDQIGKLKFEKLPMKETLEENEYEIKWIALLKKQFDQSKSFRLKTSQNYSGDNAYFSRATLFGLFYKQYITHDFYQMIKTSSSDFMVFNISHARIQKKFKHNPVSSGANNLDYNQVFMGEYFPYHFYNLKKTQTFNKYLRQLNLAKTEILTNSNYAHILLPYNNEVSRLIYKMDSADVFREWFINYMCFHTSYKQRFIWFIDKVYKSEELLENFYAPILKVMPNLPMPYLKNDAMGLIQPEYPSTTALNSNKVAINYAIITSGSYDTRYNKDFFYNSLFYVKSSTTPMDKIEKITKVLKVAHNIFSQIFNYYPYHPFFLSQATMVLKCYLNYARFETDSTTYKPVRREFQISDFATDDLLQNSFNMSLMYCYLLPSKNLLTKDNATEIFGRVRELYTPLFKRINEAIYNQEYLFALFWIQRFIYFCSFIQNHKNKSDREEKDVKAEFNKFIETYNKQNASVKQDDPKSQINQLIVKQNITSIEGNILALTKGLTLLFNFDEKDGIYLIKLNCVDFNRKEIELIKNTIEQDDSFANLKMIQIGLEKNWFKAILFQRARVSQIESLKRSINSIYNRLAKLNYLSELK